MISFNKRCSSTSIGQIAYIDEIPTPLFYKYKYALCFKNITTSKNENIAICDNADELIVWADLHNITIGKTIKYFNH